MTTTNKRRVVAITGGARGIGYHTAEELIRRGHRVAIGDIDQIQLKVAAEELGLDVAVRLDVTDPASVASFLDVTEEASWRSAVEAAVAAYGKLDIAVNNAGISGSKVTDTMETEAWHRLMAVNATGVFLGMKFQIPEMQRAGGGSIVNLSSISGNAGQKQIHFGYNASKGAVRIMSKSAAVRWGPDGVRVNTVHPGYLPAMLNGTNGGGRAAKIPQTPLRRLGEPIDVAWGVLFLASDEASFITGTELVIDGGYIAQ